MSVSGISQIHISVSDIGRAVRFYAETLGLEFLFDVPDQSMAFFNIDGVRLYLGKPESPDLESAPLIYFEVDDIESEHSRLESSGVEFVSPPHKVHETEDLELWMAFFKTSEGHVNALTEERAV